MEVRVQRDAEGMVERGQQVLGETGRFLNLAAARLAGADDPPSASGRRRRAAPRSSWTSDRARRGR